VKRSSIITYLLFLSFAVGLDLAMPRDTRAQEKTEQKQKDKPARVQEDDRPPDDRPGPGRHRHRHRFVDRDGDGFNDLAPDRDGDGIPDGIDPDMPDGRHFRRGWFRAMPDSVQSDSLKFQVWWQQRDRPVGWIEAWSHYRRMREHMRNPRFRRMMMMRREGFNPRDNRLRDDPRRGRGRHRGGGGGGPRNGPGGN
jgi:hypothetical protein